MTGGTIKNNTATGNGGGVDIQSGATFTMNGVNASIENNKALSTTATNGGGGVNVVGSGTEATSRATFTLTNGTISGNEGSSGGGIRIATNARVNMSGGAITSNKSTATTNGGGGVYVSTDTIASGMGFNMTGGTITGNTAVNDGGGIYTNKNSTATSVQSADYANLNIGVNAVLSGNSAGAGISGAPNNTSTHIMSTSASIGSYPLNNFDIVYRGKLNSGTASTWATLRTAVNAVPVNTPTTITITANFSAPTGTAGEPIVIPADRQITLVSSTGTNVRTLTQAQGHRHFTVNGLLFLGQNITLSGGAANNTNNSGGVEVKASGQLIMGTGSIIENCRRTINGGGIALAGTGTATGTRAAFILAGGTIRKNQAGEGGGGVDVGTNSRMTMTCGLIQNNATTDNANVGNLGGGGVRVPTASSVFEMSGGAIDNNTSARYGGGVHVGSSTGGAFTITGGAIRGNTAATAGGGVGIASSSATTPATFTMSGGTIENNTALTGGGIGTVIYGTYGPQLTMTGGTIQNNTATSIGGGVEVRSGATFTMNGANARIENNKSMSSSASSGGGGVYVSGYVSGDAASRATFILTKGTIIGNEGKTGGGVRVGINARMNMTDGIITGNKSTGTTDGGGGIFVSTDTIANSMGVNMTGGTISNNTAVKDGGAIYTNNNSTATTVPSTAYTNLNIGTTAKFSGNSAGNGASGVPDNTLGHIKAASVSIGNYPLNNYDIVYKGKLGQGPNGAPPAPGGTILDISKYDSYNSLNNFIDFFTENMLKLDSEDALDEEIADVAEIAVEVPDEEEAELSIKTVEIRWFGQK